MRDVTDGHVEASRKMESWLHSVALTRQELDCANSVEELVHRMLEGARKPRVRAEPYCQARPPRAPHYFPLRGPGSLAWSVCT